MADTFSRLLRAGTRFDRKRFGKDIALFEVILFRALNR